MSAELVYHVPTLSERLEYFRNCSESEASTLCTSNSELTQLLPQEYLLNLTDTDCAICHRASLICWGITEGKLVPKEMQLRKNIYNPNENLKTPVQHLIVTVEQLSKNPEGHLSKVADLLRKNPGFQKLIARINVDEAHFFYTAGLPLYGIPAFRPAWGQLDDLKRILRQSIPWHAFSATFPPHILKVVTERLLKPKFDYIHITSNRPNIIYATHQVFNSIDDVHNYECFLTSPFDPASQPHVIIFVDNKALAMKISAHLESLLSPEDRAKGIVLEQTHEAFVSPTGACRILVATSGESVGIDFPNVKVVCTAGLPSTIVDGLQRGGRAIRTGNESALFVVFYEEWVLEIDQNEYKENQMTFNDDPDRPRDILRPNSQRRERAPYSSVQLVQSTICLREFYAQYLNDETPSALVYISSFCCEWHQDGFELQNFLPARMYTPTGVKRKDPPKPSEKLCPKADRIALDDKIIEWLKFESANDQIFRPYYDILLSEKSK